MAGVILGFAPRIRRLPRYYLVKKRLFGHIIPKPVCKLFSLKKNSPTYLEWCIQGGGVATYTANSGRKVMKMVDFSP